MLFISINLFFQPEFFLTCCADNAHRLQSFLCELCVHLRVLCVTQRMKKEKGSVACRAATVFADDAVVAATGFDEVGAGRAGQDVGYVVLQRAGDDDGVDAGGVRLYLNPFSGWVSVK